jgi:hypothetical protein
MVVRDLVFPDESSTQETLSEEIDPVVQVRTAERLARLHLPGRQRHSLVFRMVKLNSAMMSTFMGRDLSSQMRCSAETVRCCASFSGDFLSQSSNEMTGLG